MQFFKHKVLGDLRLDFSDDKGSIFDTIVFAGENGSGKTTILDAISSLFTVRAKNFPECKMVCSVEKPDVVQLVKASTKPIADFDVVNITKLLLKKTRSGKVDVKMTNDDETIQIAIDYDSCVIFESGSGGIFRFYTSNIRFPILKRQWSEPGPTSPTVFSPNQRYCLEEDLQSLLIRHDYDDAEYDKQNDDALSDASRNTLALSVVRAFLETHFGNESILRISKLTDQDAIFSKGDCYFNTASLSSGEYLLISSIAFLLTHNSNLTTIDEPEQSLHPMLQSRMIELYQNALASCPYSTNNDRAQLFVATHSEYVIKNALQANAQIIVLKRDGTGIVVDRKISPGKMNLPNPTLSEITYAAFDIASSELHNELYGHIDENGWRQEFFKENGLGNINYKDSRCPGKGRPLNQSEYIRHQIHHPENKLNKKYTEKELRKSIEAMTRFIQKKKTNGRNQYGKDEK